VTGDGGSSPCAVETCWTCTGSPSIWAAGDPAGASSFARRAALAPADPNVHDAGRDTIVLEIERTDAVPLTALGDPETTDDYALCVVGPTRPLLGNRTARWPSVPSGRVGRPGKAASPTRTATRHPMASPR
jgi:hypothetical protein